MRDSLRTAVLAGLSMLAVALAAATLDSTQVEGAGEGSGGIGGGGQGGLPLPVERGTAPPGEVVDLPFLSALVPILGALAAIAVGYYLYHNWREALWIVGGLVAVTAVVAFLIVALVESPFELVLGGGNASNGSLFGGGGGGGGGGSGGDVTSTNLPSFMLVIVFGLALAGAVVATMRTPSGSSRETATAETPESADTAAVGRAAGRAADRIENADGLENEVYRAWREMTTLLDEADPDAATPGEFASAAVDAGMDRDDVAELTRLFEDVRYGDAEPSADREQRAIAIFRRIESHYAEERS